MVGVPLISLQNHPTKTPVLRTAHRSSAGFPSLGCHEVAGAERASAIRFLLLCFCKVVPLIGGVRKILVLSGHGEGCSWAGLGLVALLKKGWAWCRVGVGQWHRFRHSFGQR